jgi:glycosyltransferase involved in cell wall biosynthesis
MTVAEALAAGTPAIVTRGAPWAGLVDHGAGWWIEIGVEPLVAALQEALALPDARLGEMGCRGREWMARDFSWEGIGRQMAAFYEWLTGGCVLPKCVRF